MARNKKKENAILGEYRIKNLLREDSNFQYLEAVDSEDNVVYLQNLGSPERMDIGTIRDYFDKLIAINADNLIKPDLLIQFTPESLTLVYSKLPTGDSILKPISKDLDKTLEYLYQASECLHTLHNRRICHGLIKPESYLILNKKVYLTGFGYAPFIEMGHKRTMKDGEAFLSPEVMSSGTLTQSSDIFSFAKTIAIWEPQLKKSEWYKKATHPEPSERFSRIREAFNALENEVKRLYGKPKNDKDMKDHQEMPETTTSGSNLLPKYNIEAILIPSNAGNIKGTGSFKKDEKLTITAVPNAEWEFEKWSGDIESNESTILIIADGNKKLFASFKQKPISRWNVNAIPEPKKGGVVTGNGCFEQGKSVSLVAKALDGWAFSGWSGDANGKKNPIVIVVDKEKTITAHFEKVVIPPNVETGTLRVKPEPPEAGKIIGNGTCALGQIITIIAIPADGWEFSEWTGDVVGTNNPVKVTVDSDKLIIGKFKLIQKFRLKQTSNPPEAGVVIADRYCFNKSIEKLLARSVDPDRWGFSHWSGDVKGTKNPTTVLMDSGKSVTANFKGVSSKNSNKDEKRVVVNQEKSNEGLGKAFETISSTEKNVSEHNAIQKVTIGEAFKDSLDIKKQQTTKNAGKERKSPKLGGAFQI